MSNDPSLNIMWNINETNVKTNHLQRNIKTIPKLYKHIQSQILHIIPNLYNHICSSSTFVLLVELTLTELRRLEDTLPASTFSCGAWSCPVPRCGRCRHKFRLRWTKSRGVAWQSKYLPAWSSVSRSHVYLFEYADEIWMNLIHTMTNNIRNFN